MVLIGVVTRYRPELDKFTCIVYNHYNLKTYTLICVSLENKKSDMFITNGDFQEYLRVLTLTFKLGCHSYG